MAAEAQHYEARPESDKRHPLPDWYQDSKLEIFVHWGLYSIPGWAASRQDPHRIIAERGFGKYFRENPYAKCYLNTLKFEARPTRAYHDRRFGAHFSYEDFQPLFEHSAQNWVPDEWAQLFQRAGAGLRAVQPHAVDCRPADPHPASQPLLPGSLRSLRRPAILMA